MTETYTGTSSVTEVGKTGRDWSTCSVIGSGNLPGRRPGRRFPGDLMTGHDPASMQFRRAPARVANDREVACAGGAGSLAGYFRAQRPGPQDS
jgi:hypothetical protein